MRFRRQHLIPLEPHDIVDFLDGEALRRAREFGDEQDLRPFFGTAAVTFARSMTGMIWPRISATPRISAFAPATAVMAGIARISRTLNTLMP